MHKNKKKTQSHKTKRNTREQRESEQTKWVNVCDLKIIPYICNCFG